jgi:hypothetical protein
LGTTKYAAPDIPAKTDIIPVHASDRAQFKRCRRRWNWSSPMRNNLVSKAEQGGVAMPLWFGSGVHWALAQYYDPTLQRDPVETFKTWYDIQWNGGVITDELLGQVYDREPRLEGGYVGEAEGSFSEGTFEPGEGYSPLYIVRGLKDLLPDYGMLEHQFEEHRELGIGMLTFYKEYAEEHDNFDVIVAEHTFSVPIYDPVHDSELVMVDPRDGREKQVHLRGTQDAIIQGRETGKYGILEHKTAASIDEEYFLKLDKDEQCTTYLFAGEVEAAVHDLPYKNLEFVLYNALRKAFPKPPTITSRGNISVDRSKESTTPKMLMETIEALGMGDFWMHDDKLRNYVEYVEQIGEEQFVKRDVVYRNKRERVSCGERVYMEAMDMLAPDLRVYPNPTGHWDCLKCPFRAPCIAVDDGSDWRMLIEDSFEKNWTR